MANNAAMDSRHVRWLLSKQICIFVLHVSDVLVLMVGEVPTELRIQPKFRFELQLDELFDEFWASIKGVVSWI